MKIEDIVVNNLPKRGINKKQYSTRLSVESIEKLHKISRLNGISQSILLEYLIELADLEFVKTEKEKI